MTRNQLAGYARVMQEMGIGEEGDRQWAIPPGGAATGVAFSVLGLFRPFLLCATRGRIIRDSGGYSLVQPFSQCILDGRDRRA
jgi:hypothetical protein